MDLIFFSTDAEKRRTCKPRAAGLRQLKQFHYYFHSAPACRSRYAFVYLDCIGQPVCKGTNGNNTGRDTVSRSSVVCILVACTVNTSFRHLDSHVPQSNSFPNLFYHFLLKIQDFLMLPGGSPSVKDRSSRRLFLLPGCSFLWLQLLWFHVCCQISRLPRGSLINIMLSEAVLTPHYSSQ